MIDLDALKAAGLNSRENSERLLAEHRARQIYATTSPGVGPMGAGQPADAGPAGGTTTPPPIGSGGG